jgi:hypothetical protein
MSCAETEVKVLEEARAETINLSIDRIAAIAGSCKLSGLRAYAGASPARWTTFAFYSQIAVNCLGKTEMIGASPIEGSIYLNK